MATCALDGVGQLRLRSEEERRLAEDLLLLLEDVHLTAQLQQLGALLARGALAQALVNLGLADPDAQRTGRDAELLGRGPDAR